MKQLKEKFSKLNSEQISKYFCIGILIVLVLITFYKNLFESDEPKNNESNPKEQEVEEENKFKLLDSYSNDNYDESITITNDNELILYVIRKENSNKEMIYKSHFGKEEVFYRNNENVYALEGTGFKKTTEEIFTEVDVTFITPNSIISLINSSDKLVELKEEDYDIKRYKISIEKALNIYNELNNTNIEKNDSGYVIINVNQKNNKLISIDMDLTSLYKSLKYEYNNVKYHIELNNLTEVNISNDFELPE